MLSHLVKMCSPRIRLKQNQMGPEQGIRHTSLLFHMYEICDFGDLPVQNLSFVYKV